MKYCEKSIREVCNSNEEILRKIYEHMIETRPIREVRYEPCTLNKYSADKLLVGLDFKEIYPEFEDGDFVFMASGYDSNEDMELIHCVKNHLACETYFEGKKCESTIYNNGESVDANVFFKKGENVVITKVIAENGEMCARPVLLIPELHSGGYGGIPVRRYIPLEGFKEQYGPCYSKLYKKGEEVEVSIDTIEWACPILPEQSNVKEFDFNELCKVGKAAYVHTAFKGKMKISHTSPLKIFADGEEIYRELSGNTELKFKKETKLLFKSIKGEETWGFKAESKGTHTLPGVTTDNFDDLHWIWVGPFGRMEDSIDCPYPPEAGIKFNEPYPTIHDSRVYWNFYRKDTVLVQVLTTKSFAVWFYACMVGAYFLKELANKLNIPELHDYFKKNMNILCNHREFAAYEIHKYGWAGIQHFSAVHTHLDFIGSFGMNICEYYLMTGSRDALNMIHVLGDKILHNIPRFSDGTYNRIKTVWADDIYMSLPFLVRLGVVTGETKYFDEIMTQINGYYERMFMKDQSIFSHLYFVEEQTPNRIPWGRGNGWIILSLSDVLMLMPESYEGKARLLEIYKEYAKGILNCRNKEGGMWHQVINNHDSYEETSGTAMFIIALARGVRMGWIDDCTKELVEAWEALTSKCIDSEGNVFGVCKGSGCSMDESYYVNLGTCTNDDHGIGAVIGAGIEIMNLLGE